MRTRFPWLHHPFAADGYLGQTPTDILARQRSQYTARRTVNSALPTECFSAPKKTALIDGCCVISTASMKRLPKHASPQGITRADDFRLPSQIRELRLEAGLTQEDAARLIEVSMATWQGWERGQRKIRPTQLRQFCRHLESLFEHRLQKVRDLICTMDAPHV